MSSSLLTPWPVAWQAPLCIEFSRQECCNGLPFLSSSQVFPPQGLSWQLLQLLHWQADSFPLGRLGSSSHYTWSLLYMSDSLWLHGLQPARLLCPSLSPGRCTNSCPLSWWCHPTTSSSIVPFSSCPQSFPASGSFSLRIIFHDNSSSGFPSVLSGY